MRKRHKHIESRSGGAVKYVSSVNHCQAMEQATTKAKAERPQPLSFNEAAQQTVKASLEASAIASGMPHVQASGNGHVLSISRLYTSPTLCTQSILRKYCRTR